MSQLGLQQHCQVSQLAQLLKRNEPAHAATDVKWAMKLVYSCCGDMNQTVHNYWSGMNKLPFFMTWKEIPREVQDRSFLYFPF
jgi:hypothetical protein